MSSPQDFFVRLKRDSLGGEKTDRLERELRDHLEDADNAGAVNRLGEPAVIASIYNRIRYQQNAPEWIFSVILLGFFALLIQYLVVWLMDGMMNQMCLRCIGGTSGYFTLNPSESWVNKLSFLAFVSVFGLFVVQMRRLFELTGRTIYTFTASMVIILIPFMIHVWSFLEDPVLYRTLFPIDLLVTSFVVVLVLVTLGFVTRDKKLPLFHSQRLRTIFWILVFAYILTTSITFMIPSADGGLTDISVSSRFLYLLASTRLLLEQSATTMLTSSLSFLSPPVMWNVMGTVLTLAWVVCLLVIGRVMRETKRMSLGAVAGLLYLSSILSFGATDRPDVNFSAPIQLVSLTIEQRQIPVWSSLHAYLQRLGSPFPIYHTAWDEKRQVFVIDQSAWPFHGDHLAPVSSWTVDPATTAVVENQTTTRISPNESDDDDDTLAALTEKGFACDTDEPFPSCFKLFYHGQEIFSHDTRSIVVTQAIASPDNHWVLLTLTMRYSGNEYVYLVNLKS